MTLSVRFWGTRGSVPSPGARTVRYGGNTPCLEVRSDSGALVILDAGTGIRELGRRLVAEASSPLDGDIFLTHAHWDHIQGLPFFDPLYREGQRFRLWVTPELRDRVERAVRAQMAPEVFPVPFDEIRAELEFRALEPGAGSEDGARVTAAPVRHPGGAFGFRVTAGNARGAALVYIPDSELSPEAAYDAPPDWRARLVEFVRGAEVLVHDAMYTAPEQARHVGWGHSSVDQAVELAAEAGVRTLVLFHHHPDRSDEAVDALLAHARALAGRQGEDAARMVVIAAAEGANLTI